MTACTTARRSFAESAMPGTSGGALPTTSAMLGMAIARILSRVVILDIFATIGTNFSVRKVQFSAALSF